MSDADNKPLISVISITLNDRDGLLRTIESLLSQTDAPNYEHIIVDGVSDYNVVELLSEAGSTAQLRQGKDAGLYDAMNTGTELAQGDYLLYLNSGDTLAEPKVLSQISAVLTAERPDFLWGDSFERQLDGEIRYKLSRPIKRLPLGMISHHQAMLFRRDVVQRNYVKYDLSYKIAADYDFVLRHVRSSRSTHYLPIPFCVFERGGTSYQQSYLGRREQFRIRRIFYKSTAFAVTVYIAQWTLLTFRSLFPTGYWALRKRLS